MTDQTATAPSSIPQPRAVGPEELGRILRAGWEDFRKAPQFGLFFAAFYVVGGIVLFYGFFTMGQPFWFIPFMVGFPILAPFAAMGLYDVSRRMERGEPLEWGAILGVLVAQRDRQLPFMAVVVIIAFGFWVILARVIFALFFSQTGIGAASLGMLLSWNGVGMLIVGTVVGAAIAAALYSVTVISLPLLLDREVDFVTAMITSYTAVVENPKVMLSWAALIAGLLFVAMIPAFLGLLVVMPVLGHASWHMYRAVLRD